MDLHQDVERELPKAAFSERCEALTLELVGLQRKIIELGIPVLVVFEGWDAAGKGDCMNFLMTRLDPRGARVVPFLPRNEEERLRPRFWRYWRALPGKGKIVLFDRSYYHYGLDDRVMEKMKGKAWRELLGDFRSFEETLAADGTVVLKLWLHVSKKEQGKRLEALEDDKDTRWRIGKTEWRRHERYEDLRAQAEGMLRATHAQHAPWQLVPATDRRYRRWAALDAVVKALREACQRVELADKKDKNGKREKRPEISPGTRGPWRGQASNPLDRLNLSQKYKGKDYQAELETLQERLRSLQFRSYKKRAGVVIVFEGSDAAGKGGAIRRLAASLDPRGYSVVPVAAPKGDDAAHHYLWRFWKEMPKMGHWTVFDRSWYGRVLVERVEGFCREDAWRRSYGEIREFERQILDAGYALVKLWLQIGKDEQLKRFKARQTTPHKTWKITDEDWRNREKWDPYRAAAGDMIDLTSARAPWTLVAANDKRWARLEVLRAVAEGVEAAL